MNRSNEELRRIYKAFPKAFVNSCNEMIIYITTNSYFRLDDVYDEEELDCKVLEYCSREASKGRWQSKKYHFEGICKYFNHEFTQDEMDLIYTRLGNGCNRKLCIEFIRSGFDLSVLNLY